MGYICYQQEKQKEEPTGKTTIYKKNSNPNDEIEIESHDTKGCTFEKKFFQFI